MTRILRTYYHKREVTEADNQWKTQRKKKDSERAGQVSQERTGNRSD